MSYGSGNRKFSNNNAFTGQSRPQNSDISYLENMLKQFVSSEIEQNIFLTEKLQEHDICSTTLSNKIGVLSSDVHTLEGRTKAIELQVAKIAEGWTRILSHSAGKPEPNPVENIRVIRTDEEDDLEYEEDDQNQHYQVPLNYLIDELIKILHTSHPLAPEIKNPTHEDFIHKVALEVRKIEAKKCTSRKGSL